MTFRFFIALIFLLISGCSVIDAVSNLVGGDDEMADPPAPLVEFKQKLNVVELWSKNTGSGTDEKYLMISPIIANQHLYIVDSRGELKVMDAINGKQKWSKNIIGKGGFWSKDDNTRITGGPGYGENTILVGTNEGDTITMDSNNGEGIWQKKLSSEILSAPQKADNVVVVRTLDGKLFALNGDTGKRLWIYERSVPALTLRGTSTPIINNGMVIAGFDGGRLAALELGTGRLIWEVRISIARGSSDIERMVDIDSEPIIVDGVIFVASFQGHIAAVHQETGRIIWNRELSSYAGFSVDEDNVYVTDNDSHIWAFDRFSGTPMWEQDKLHGRHVTAPASIGAYVVVGDFEGYLHWISKISGTFVARTRVSKHPFMVKPLVAGKFLYAYNSDGELAAYTYR